MSEQREYVEYVQKGIDDGQWCEPGPLELLIEYITQLEAERGKLRKALQQLLDDARCVDTQKAIDDAWAALSEPEEEKPENPCCNCGESLMPPVLKRQGEVAIQLCEHCGAEQLN